MYRVFVSQMGPTSVVSCMGYEVMINDSAFKQEVVIVLVQHSLTFVIWEPGFPLLGIFCKGGSCRNLKVFF